MNPYLIQANDVAKLQSEQGGACPVLTWGGNDYKILPGSVMQNKPLREGGFSSAFDFSCLLVASQFFTVAIPDVTTLKNALFNSPFTYLGDSYKFVNVHILSGGTLLRIEANALNQNA